VSNAEIDAVSLTRHADGSLDRVPIADQVAWGLAFGREQSGSVTVPGTKRASGSCPAGCMAKVELGGGGKRRRRGW